MKRLLFSIGLVSRLCFTLFDAHAQSQAVVNGMGTAAVIFPAGGCTYKWANNNQAIGLTGSGIGDIPSFTAINKGITPVTATITVTPVPTPLAYIANYGSNNVSVINTISNLVIATIPVGTNPFGVSASPDGTLVYVTNEGSNNVSVISTLTNIVTAIIPVQSAPKGVVVSPDGTRVYVANIGSNTISVIDAATNGVLSNISAVQSPYGVAITPDGKTLYVSGYNTNSVSVINLATMGVITLPPVFTNPSGIAVSPNGLNVYVANEGSNTIMTISTVSNTVTTTTSVYGHPAGVTLNPQGTLLYIAGFGADFYITLVLATNTSFGSATGSTPYGVSVTPGGSTIYMTWAGGNAVEYHASTSTAGGLIDVGTKPFSLGNFISKGPACNASPTTFTITVNPSPTIKAGAVTGSITACVGTASEAPIVQQFTVSGGGLSGNVTATAPTNFEISLSPGSGYANSIMLMSSGGAVTNTSVYVRTSASAPVGNISGKVVLSAAGATDVSVAVKARVNALSYVNAVPNQGPIISGNMTAPVNFTGTADSYVWTNNMPGIGLAASGIGNIGAFKAINTGTLPVTATVTVTPTPVDYLYLTNAVANTLEVVNTQSNTVTASIPTENYPVGVTVSPDRSKVYVANENYGPGSVSVISTTTNAVIATIPVDVKPWGIVASPDGKWVYTANETGNTVSVISTASNSVIATIQVSFAPVGIAISPDGRRIYVAAGYNNIDNVDVIDASTNSVIKSIPVGKGPWALAVSPDGTRVYVADAAANTASVINTATNMVIATIPAGVSPEGVVVSRDGTRVYIANYYSNTVSVVDAATNRIIATLPCGVSPGGVSVSPDGKKLYVNNSNSGSISVFDTQTNAVINTLSLGGQNSQALGDFLVPSIGCAGIPITFTITVDPIPQIIAAGAPSAVNTTYGTASASSSFTLSGINLTGGVLVTPPPGFEVSTDNINFSNTVNVGGTGNVTATQVYIRLSSQTDAGSYSGNIVLISTGAATVNVGMPISIVSPVLLTIRADDDSKVYGSVLTSVTGSTAFSISSGALQNGNTISSVDLTYGAGAPAAAAAGTYATITPVVSVAGNGFLPANYTITYLPGTIVVTPAPLTITANNLNKPFGTALINGSSTTGFISSGLQNQETIGSVTMIYGNGAAATDQPGIYPGSITPSGPAAGTFSAANYTITYQPGDITVEAPTLILTSGTLSPLTTVYGTPSPSASFSVSGSNLPAGILITPPPGFEMSTDNTNFYPTITTGSGGTTAAVPIFIRLAAITPVGGYAGNIRLSSAGNYNTTEAMPTSTVTTTPLTIAADNKTRAFGAVNPPLTITYIGFVNNENAAQLTSQPVVFTLAVSTSPVGQYVITVSGATSPNYTITNVPGTLTVEATAASIVIPNTFTPNGDGVNDVWNIPYLATFSSCNVFIYDRYGSLVYNSIGYAKAWDGTYNGKRLPTGVYYYLINLKPNIKPLSGPVTIIR